MKLFFSQNDYQFGSANYLQGDPARTSEKYVFENEIYTLRRGFQHHSISLYTSLHVFELSNIKAKPLTEKMVSCQRFRFSV